jgi:hypothetical protein
MVHMNGALRPVVSDLAFAAALFAVAVAVYTSRHFIGHAEFYQGLSLTRGDVSVPDTQPPNHFQEASRYLLLTVAWWWRRVGISWNAIWTISSVMFGLSVAACYAIFRLWFAPLFAAAGALFLSVSTVHLERMPQLRDYAKAPFMLGALFFAWLVVLRPLSRPTLGMASVACGAIVGIGFGFRMDVASWRRSSSRTSCRSEIAARGPGWRTKRSQSWRL